MSKFQLVLLVHAHQPVGNFDEVFEQVYRRSYLPFVECLARHPGVRMGLHYTGPLLEWFEQRHPEFLEQLGDLARRNQIELVGGGFYEPILVSIPPEDQIEQIVRMREYLARVFGAAPSGAWLAERVWEPQLPFALASAGVKYTLVDDVHFEAAGFELDELHGDFICEDRGRTVRVFPGLKELRYLLPFRSVEDAFTFLRGAAARHPDGMAAMGDDCEKFGAWPGTYDHCYRDGWLDQFFVALEAARNWLLTTPPGEYVATRAPLGRADLPTASYTEMMEWVLPTVARHEFRAVQQECALRPNVLRFLRGGQWRGFFSKYAESNLLNKKMLYVSRQLRELAAQGPSDGESPKLSQARTHLLRAQCNDAYWHGVFGGLYAPHLRTELWKELVRAESLAAEMLSGCKSEIRVEHTDFDADGNDELYVTSSRMAALIRPTDGGTLEALDFRPTGVTLINSLQRRVEAYHSRLREASQSSGSRVASIHDRVRAKEEGLERFLRYDRFPRNSFRLLLFSKQKTFEDYRQLTLEEHAGLAASPYRVLQAAPGAVQLECETPLVAGPAAGAAGELLRCSKRFSFAHDGRGGYRIGCEMALDSAKRQPCHAQIGIEIVLNLLAPDAADRYFDTSGGRHPLRWLAALPASPSPSAGLRLVDEWQNVAVAIEAPAGSQLWIAPIETVSESEEGFERVYQGSQILVVWPVELAAGSPWRAEVALRVEPARNATHTAS